MPKFPLEHLEGCLPHAPCACCQALALLKGNLECSHYQQFIKFAYQAYGEEGGVETNTAKATPDPLLMQLIDDRADLTVRTSTILKNEGIVTLRDLVGKSEEDILHIPHAGHKFLSEVKEILDTLGLRLGMEV